MSYVNISTEHSKYLKESLLGNFFYKQIILKNNHKTSGQAIPYTRIPKKKKALDCRNWIQATEWKGTRPRKYWVDYHMLNSTASESMNIHMLRQLKIILRQLRKVRSSSKVSKTVKSTLGNLQDSKLLDFLNWFKQQIPKDRRLEIVVDGYTFMSLCIHQKGDKYLFLLKCQT